MQSGAITQRPGRGLPHYAGAEAEPHATCLTTMRRRRLQWPHRADRCGHGASSGRRSARPCAVRADHRSPIKPVPATIVADKTPGTGTARCRRSGAPATRAVVGKTPCAVRADHRCPIKPMPASVVADKTPGTRTARRCQPGATALRAMVRKTPCAVRADHRFPINPLPASIVAARPLAPERPAAADSSPADPRCGGQDPMHQNSGHDRPPMLAAVRKRPCAVRTAYQRRLQPMPIHRVVGKTSCTVRNTSSRCGAVPCCGLSGGPGAAGTTPCKAARVRVLPADPITLTLAAHASRPLPLPRERFCYSQNAAARWNFSQRRITRGSTSVVVPAAAKPSTSPAA